MKKQIRNTFSWSVSRDGVFHECPRRYYFKYYGHWGGWERDAPERTRAIYVLGKLSNRHMWVGRVVHECIARSLQNLSRGVPVLGVDEILSITRNRLRRDFRASRAKRYWQNPKAYCGLIEHEFDMDISDDTWREAAEGVDRCLENFYASKVFETLRALEPAQYLEIENRSAEDFEGTPVWIALDCATREGNHIIVWDWKTGKRDTKPGLTLQMACYAFYAQQRFSVPLRHVITRRFDLFGMNLHEQTISQREMNEILPYIRGSIKDMRSLLDDVENNTATEERFHKVERESTCRRCPFLSVCEPNV